MKFDYGNAEFGIKAGYDFDAWRAYGAYIYSTKVKDRQNLSVNGVKIAMQGEWNSHNFVVGADWMPAITENFKGVLGAYTGFAIGKFEAKASAVGVNASEDGSATGFIFGAKIGALYGFDEHSEVEFGFKGENVAFDDGDVRNYGAYIGYNYKF